MLASVLTVRVFVVGLEKEIFAFVVRVACVRVWVMCVCAQCERVLCECV